MLKFRSILKEGSLLKLKNNLSSESVLSYIQFRICDRNSLRCQHLLLWVVFINLFQIIFFTLSILYFTSKKARNSELKHISYKSEVIVVIEDLKKIIIQVLNIPFKILTNCSTFKTFKVIMDRKDVSSKIFRWALMSSNFGYTVEHKDVLV